MNQPARSCSATSSPPHSLCTLARVVVVGLLLNGCRPQPPEVHAAVEATGQPRQIRVNGIATLEVKPDVVDLTLTLSVVGKRPKAVMAELREKQQPLVVALAAAGVSESELRLSHIDVSPTYKPHPNNHVIDGYKASITLVATLADFDKLGDVMEAAASRDVERMYTRFRSTKLAEKKKEVREMALKATRDKARQMASSMEVTLGEVLSIVETAGTGAMWGAVGNANRYVSATPGEKLQPGAIELSLTLEAAFRLE